MISDVHAQKYYHQFNSKLYQHLIYFKKNVIYLQECQELIETDIHSYEIVKSNQCYNVSLMFSVFGPQFKR